MPRPFLQLIANLGGGKGPGSGQQVSGFLAAAGKGVGLGFAAAGRSVPKAMTSSMMAASTNSKGGGVQLTFKKAMGLSIGGSTPPIISPSPALSSSGPLIATGGVIPGNTAANPYIEGQGMGRGKHLTKPSWSINGDHKDTSLGSVSESAFSTSSRVSEAPSSSATKLNSDPDQFQDVSQSGISKGSDGLVALKRSRFSASTNPLEVIPAIGLQPSSHIHIESSTVFMSSHQVTVDDIGDSNTDHLSNSIPTAGAASTKRSRWDK